MRGRPFNLQSLTRAVLKALERDLTGIAFKPKKGGAKLGDEVAGVMIRHHVYAWGDVLLREDWSKVAKSYAATLAAEIKGRKIKVLTTQSQRIPDGYLVASVTGKKAAVVGFAAYDITRDQYSLRFDVVGG